MNAMKRGCWISSSASFIAIVSIVTGASTGPVSAQTLITLHSFSATSTNAAGISTNSDGTAPYWFTLSGDTIYGSAAAGGPLGYGLIFALKTDGSGFTNLHNFAGPPKDGADPADLVLSGNRLYGAARSGGSTGSGTLFALQTDGTGFTNLYQLSTNGFDWEGNVTTNHDGYSPVVGAVSSGNVLFGTALHGGPEGAGTIFGLDPAGNFTVLHAFSYLAFHVPPANADGAWPNGLILAGQTLYGTTQFGGNGGGNVYSIKTDGSAFQVLHDFSSTYPRSFPVAPVTISSNTLYGTTPTGGSAAVGFVFAVNTDGSGYQVLHNFGGNPDGGSPLAGLALSSNMLYGETIDGGASGYGTIFTARTDGSGYAILHNFNASDSDGTGPAGQVIVAGNVLYGTTGNVLFGTPPLGTLFKLLLAPESPPLTITTSNTNLVLTWPTNSVGYSLVAAPSLDSSTWGAVPAVPVITNGQSMAIIPLSGTQQFYRLTH
jgi:uncharacterized repeat protein (TIGR03803 family)